MLDYCETILLKYIVSESMENYKLLEVCDLEDILLKYGKKRQYNVINILQRLQNKNYINIKYNDDGKVCLCSTTLGKQIIENEQSERQKTRKIKIELTFLIVLITIFAFLGAFLGTLLSNIIL